MFALWLLALLHLYIGWRIAPELPGTIAPWALAAVLLASAVLIPLAWFGRRSRTRARADRLSWAGMLALGLLSTLLVLTLLRDVLLLFAWPLGLVQLPEWSAVAVVGGAALFMAIGVFNARRTARVRDVELPVANLPA